ncbi:unnamed protein product [Schistosoma margrebowiei]|uniref:Uncharacterized protein n=1 Tax=Schistosoma margrebowiei TaxID=48269 RepID=A0A183MJP8_9TREM|nr:unnamed protein product [Schistosoma margrebowiei]
MYDDISSIHHNTGRFVTLKKKLTINDSNDYIQWNRDFRVYIYSQRIFDIAMSMFQAPSIT